MDNISYALDVAELAFAACYVERVARNRSYRHNADCCNPSCASTMPALVHCPNVLRCDRRARDSHTKQSYGKEGCSFHTPYNHNVKIYGKSRAPRGTAIAFPLGHDFDNVAR